ncbi:hypothetical protein D0B54_18470 [Solimonas sp. K1W22B-7]|uniref:hypothetical protein n=1 Tax=Solimonas sp. K1W22B-7 TaxID=2303331 RepID=UPI000E336B71|nr:hypothetical protein [Solimonas sp. K1W22B-7]AXQ30545.1 hypothetical protein D0B54_18470 [Solimonas sp. K1W22B-7]
MNRDDTKALLHVVLFVVMGLGGWLFDPDNSVFGIFCGMFIAFWLRLFIDSLGESPDEEYKPLPPPPPAKPGKRRDS